MAADRVLAGFEGFGRFWIDFRPFLSFWSGLSEPVLAKTGFEARTFENFDVFRRFVKKCYFLNTCYPSPFKKFLSS